MEALAPLTPQFFIDHGQSPENAAVLASQASSPAARAGLMSSAPAAAPVSIAPAMSQAEAQAKIAAVTADRSAGKLSDYAWREMQADMDKWISTAAGEPQSPKIPASDALPRTSNASANDYVFNEPPTGFTDADRVANPVMAEALNASGFDKASGDAIISAAYQAREEFGTPEKYQTRVASVADDLSRIWGDQFERKVGVFKSELAAMGQGRPALHAALRAANLLPPLIIDRIVAQVESRSLRR